MDKNKVVWSEGMFLSPQHFQQQERYLEGFTKDYCGLMNPSRYGLADFNLDHSMTNIGKVGIKNARGIFPDGTPFDIRNGLALDIPAGTIDKIVYLAMPIYRSGVVNVGEKSDRNRRYHRVDHNVFDTSRGNNEALQLELAELNIVLKLEGEDLQDYTLIPIAHVSEHKSDGEIELNQAFIPAALYFTVSNYLKEGVSELYAQMQYRARSISQRLKVESASKSHQALMRDYLWLQSLGRWLPMVKYWLDVGTTSPQDVYLQCLQIAGEMQGLNGDMPQEYQGWNTRKLYALFSTLFVDMRILLREVQLDNVTTLTWDSSLFLKRRLLRTLVQDRGLYNAGRFILVVSSSLGSVQLSEQFPLAVKLAGNSAIADLVRNSLSGVPLRTLPIAPSELKLRTDAAYFELDTQSELWHELVQKDEPIALHVDSRIGDVDIEFYVIR
ncbi:type VI secretion system baseplate subunit TssK [Photobacterium swingsii]|uniref:Type VI secretion system baseplate subunit TssK n=1 Tax=Photobacterium swingsii TaxID=680026 RepID=A0A0J8VEY2_9GAMM|nr:type VI secretion system baseplate subunit TssK [Photobacterium swingsii]KMV31095.1 type VI secretion protein [Photobacterium swingsii]PSW23597.1 type VI secretion system baseplate subunit TssK [Photobacterium swingsii]